MDVVKLSTRLKKRFPFVQFNSQTDMGGRVILISAYWLKQTHGVMFELLNPTTEKDWEEAEQHITSELSVHFN